MTTLLEPRLMRPRYRTLPKSRLTTGPSKIAWCENTMTTLKGPRAGQPLRFLLWERHAINRLYEVSDTGMHRYRSGLIGVGRQNGKSIIGSSLGVEALFRGPVGSEIYSAAGDRTQARIVFNEAKRQVQQSQRLSSQAKIYRDAIEIPSKGNVYRVLSADAKLQQGLSPYFVVFDEVHVQRDDELWNAMQFGMAARPNAILLGITTAGDHEDSLCGRMYEYGKKLAEGEGGDDSFFFMWWEPQDAHDPESGKIVPCDIFDESAWEQANPALLEGVLDYDEMRQAAMKSREGAFRRYRLNQWVGQGGERWMDMTAWDACEVEPVSLKPRTPVVVSFDGSVDNDATALSVIRCDLDMPVLVETFVWERQPEDGDDWQVDRSDVDSVVEELFANYRVLKMACDPAYWRSEIQGWQDRFGGRKVLEWPVTDARMGPAVTETYKRVKDGEFGHVPDPVVRRHVRNAVTKDTRAGHQTIRKVKPKSEHKIDAAVTVCIGVDLWTRYAKPKRSLVTM